MEKKTMTLTYWHKLLKEVNIEAHSSSFICLFRNEGWLLSGTFSISLCLLHFLLVS